jgi:hypothetical protein
MSKISRAFADSDNESEDDVLARDLRGGDAVFRMTQDTRTHVEDLGPCEFCHGLTCKANCKAGIMWRKGKWEVRDEKE